MKFSTTHPDGSNGYYSAPTEAAVRKYVSGIAPDENVKIEKATADDIAWFKAYYGPAMKLDKDGRAELSDEQIAEEMGNVD